MGLEIEWAVSRGDGDEFSPACQGPAYGMTRIVELSDYSRELLDALAAEGVAVAQFHPEYASSQLELSTDPADPVAAADLSILVRETVRAVASAQGLRVSFAPRVEAGTVGNGGHLHVSAWANGHNLFAGGLGPYGLSDRGESMLARILQSLPALCGVGAPSVASYLRLVPSHWAGCYQCWGLENREAALRLVTGPFNTEASAANAEIKCFDLAANPYLLVGSVMAVALDGLERGLRLPTEVYGDPVSLGDDEALAMLGIERLPTSLSAATDALESHAGLRLAMGEPLFGAVVAVRRAEVKLLDGKAPEEVVAATRWRY
jgi:glutamine synthetase